MPRNSPPFQRYSLFYAIPLCTFLRVHSLPSSYNLRTFRCNFLSDWHSTLRGVFEFFDLVHLKWQYNKKKYSNYASYSQKSLIRLLQLLCSHLTLEAALSEHTISTCNIVWDRSLCSSEGKAGKADLQCSPFPSPPSQKPSLKIIVFSYQRLHFAPKEAF